MADTALPIARLKGLGPKSEAMLARAGIMTCEELQALGSVAAFVQAKRANPGVSLNLLWGLESALTGVPWQVVARAHRGRLLLALDDLERGAWSGAEVLFADRLAAGAGSGES